MDLGISTYSYTWATGVPGKMPELPMTAKKLIDLASTFRVQRLQIADNNPLFSQSEKIWLELRDYAKAKNIQIEIGGRGMKPDNLEEYINMASFFNSPILRMVIDAEGFEPDMNAIISILKNALPLLESKGIILALENHDRFPSMVFNQIIREINHPKVGICLDSVNSMGIGEGLETVVNNLAPFTVNLHVKDYSVSRINHKMGFVVEGKPAGKGLLNLPWILEKLSPFNRCQSAILELWTPPSSTLDETIKKEHEWAVASIAYMKQVVH